MRAIYIKGRDIKKTRAIHECSGCSRCIKIGESCHEQNGIYDYGFYSCYICDVCIAFTKHIGDKEFNDYTSYEMQLRDHPDYDEFAATYVIEKELRC